MTIDVEKERWVTINPRLTGVFTCPKCGSDDIRLSAKFDLGRIIEVECRCKVCRDAHGNNTTTWYEQFTWVCTRETVEK